MKVLIFILSILLSSLLKSQPESILQPDDVIKAISSIRDHLVEQSDTIFSHFVALEHKIWDSDIPEDKKRLFIGYIQSTINIDNLSNHYYQVKDLLKDKKYRKTYVQEFESIEKEWASIKSVIKNFSSIGLIDKAYPYVISLSDTFVDELEFYQLHHGKVIGEIGAGKGRFGVLLAHSLHSSDVYLNDISKKALEHMNYTISLLDSIDYSSRLFVVKGNKSNTKLPKNHFDFIIIRSSFHHFSKLDKMIKSVKRNLTEDGVLYLREPIKSDKPKPTYLVCPFELSKDEIVSALNKHGFKLINERPNGPFLLMKFINKA